MFSIHSAVLWGNACIEDPGTRKSRGQWLEQAQDTGSVSIHLSPQLSSQEEILGSVECGKIPGCVMLSSYEPLGCASRV